MGELRLHAISVYEIRDMFGALPDLAAQLRQIAAQQFAVPAAEHQKRPSLIQRIGPMFRHDPLAIAYPPDQPTPRDWEALIEGRHVEPDRLAPSWRVVDAWVEQRDRGTATFTMSPAEMEAFDFSLTRAGLPAHFGLRNLLANDVAIPLRPVHGMHVGYAKNAHVLATRQALAEVLPRVEEGPNGPARHLADYLAAFTDWTEQARRADQLLPDLFVIWWRDGRGAEENPGSPMASACAPTGPTPTGPVSTLAGLDPAAPIVTGRQGRRETPRQEPWDPTQPIVTGRRQRPQR